jgi:hypothetical protein
VLVIIADEVQSPVHDEVRPMGSQRFVLGASLAAHHFGADDEIA